MMEIKAVSVSKVRRIIRLPEVIHLCGLKRSSIYQKIKERKFPAPCQIGVRAVGWDSLEIDRWIDQKLGVDIS